MTAPNDSIEDLIRLLADRYTIEREIGAGGMARVYLARDLRHDRRVAIKVLNQELASMLGADRFLSEIKLTASLHHPNLLPLHDSGDVGGRLFYVMPHVAGGSLRVRLEREKHLPVDEAVRIAVGVAAALQYAHKHGIIHRDLKPENILLHEGQPLVADFGIALAVKSAGGERLTHTGLSLGTPQYSSPEQAMGDRVIDGRSDIYALGVVLYEMLAGDPPHQASTLQAVIAKVITERPRDIRSIRNTCPEHVARAIDCCLSKLAADRFSTAQEFSDAVQGHPNPRSPFHHTPIAQSIDSVRPGYSHRRNAVWYALVGIAASAATLTAMHLSEPLHEPHERAVRFSLTIDEDETIATGVLGSPLAISPDGGEIAYLSTGVDGVQQLHLRSVGVSRAHVVPGTLRALHPTFSPEGNAIAFMAGTVLERVDIVGGANPKPIATVRDTVYGVAWASRDFVLGRIRGGLLAVPVAGGTTRELTMVDTAQGERSHRWPVVLSDGKSALFTIWRGRNATARIAVVSLDNGKVTRLNVDGAAALGVVDEQLIYADSTGRIMAVPFSSRRLRVTGVAVAGEQSTVSLPGAAKAALSSSGTLVFSIPQAASLEMVLVDTLGVARTLLDQRERFLDPRYSPDGRTIAVAIRSDTTSDIFLFDVETKTRQRLTGQSGVKTRPEWMAGGKRVLYRKVGSAGAELWEREADKSLQAARVVPAEREASQGLPVGDGKSVIYRTDSESRFGMNLWWLDTTTARPEAQVIASGRAPAISPDNRWIAYSSSSNGMLEIFVRALPIDARRDASCQISDDGGSEPAWSRDGTRLYYRNGRQLIAATVRPAPTGCPSVLRKSLFEMPAYSSEYHRQYDVAPNASGFVMLREYVHDSGIEVVHNWLMDLRTKIEPGAPK